MLFSLSFLYRLYDQNSVAFQNNGLDGAEIEGNAKVFVENSVVFIGLTIANLRIVNVVFVEYLNILRLIFVLLIHVLLFFALFFPQIN